MIDVAVWRAEILAKRSQEALNAYEAANADYYAARAVYDTELVRIKQEFSQ